MKRHLISTLLILLVLFVSSYSPVNERALFSDKVYLTDSQDYSFKFLFANHIFSEKLINDKDFIALDGIVKFPLVRAFSVSEGVTMHQMGEFVNHISSERSLGYWNTLTGGQSEDCKKIHEHDQCNYIRNGKLLFYRPSDGLLKFSKKLFNHKSIRNLLFDFSLGIVKNQCKKYPKDFTIDLISDLNDLLTFCDEIENYSNAELLNEIDNPFSHPIKQHYWKGFIVRRILAGVELEEVKSRLNTALNEIKSIDILSFPEVYYKITFNDIIDVNFNRGSYSINSKDSGKKIPMDYNDRIIKVQFFDDNGYSFYIFTFKSEDRGQYDIIYDKNLELIN